MNNYMKHILILVVFKPFFFKGAETYSRFLDLTLLLHLKLLKSEERGVHEYMALGEVEEIVMTIK